MKNEIVKVETTQLEDVVKNSGLQIQEGEEIKQSYLPFLNDLAEIQQQATKINFENPQIIDETIARELRLRTVKIRTGSESLKDSRKRIHLLKGNLEQAAYNLIAASCKLTEEAFNNVEKAREIAEKKRKEERKAERAELLSPFGIDTTFIDLLNMPDESFLSFLESTKDAYNKKIEAEKKAEEERLAAIEAEKKRQEEIRLENERLKKEAAEKEKALEAEREKTRKENEEKERLAEIERQKQAKILKDQQEKAAKEKAELLAKAEKERKEKERLEKEIADKKAAQERAEKEAEAKRKAEEKAKLLAPDKEKIAILVKDIQAIKMPEVKSLEMKALVSDVEALLNKVVKFINERQ